jgi:hypothetical protein
VVDGYVAQVCEVVNIRRVESCYIGIRDLARRDHRRHQVIYHHHHHYRKLTEKIGPPHIKGYGVEGEEAKLQPEQEGATIGNITFSLLRQRTTAGSGARGGAGGVRQGEVEDQEVGPSTGAPRGQVGWVHQG